MDILRVKKAHPPPVPTPARRRVTSAPIVPAEAQASDVAIENGFNLPTTADFSGVHPPPAFTGNPLHAGQSQTQPHFGNFAQGMNQQHQQHQASTMQSAVSEQAQEDLNDAEDSDVDSSSSSDSDSDSDSSDNA